MEMVSARTLAGYNIMRNIKLTFEHPCYIYPFKVGLFHPSDPERLSYQQTEQAIARLRQDLILTPEE